MDFTHQDPGFIHHVVIKRQKSFGSISHRMQMPIIRHGSLSSEPELCERGEANTLLPNG